MTLNEKIRDLRIDRDLTQKRIAEILKTTTQYYQKYEKGVHPLPTEHLKTLCEFYEVSADDLLDLPKGLPSKKEAKYKKGLFNPMTKNEIIEEYFEEIVKILRGAAEQKFSGEELFAILELEAWKIKEELKNKV